MIEPIIGLYVFTGYGLNIRIWCAWIKKNLGKKCFKILLFPSEDDRLQQEHLVGLQPEDEELIGGSWSNQEEDESDSLNVFPSSGPEILIETTPTTLKKKKTAISGKPPVASTSDPWQTRNQSFFLFSIDAYT